MEMRFKHLCIGTVHSQAVRKEADTSVYMDDTADFSNVTKHDVSVIDEPPNISHIRTLVKPTRTPNSFSKTTKFTLRRHKSANTPNSLSSKCKKSYFQADDLKNKLQSLCLKISQICNEEQQFNFGRLLERAGRELDNSY